MIALRLRRFEGTTLVSPSRWSIFALSLLFTVEIYGSATGASATSLSTQIAMRYLAATASFCPLIAVLGAKRPQNIGWQLIVATFWVVLILPVGEMFVLWQGGAMDVGPARRWLLVILMFVGLTNYALTRFGFAALLFTVGQSFMLLPHLPIVGRETDWSFSAGCLLSVAAAGLVWWQTVVRRTAGGWDVVWLEFRNAFGLVWALRVMERVNSTAQLSHWKRELTWFGFVTAPSGDYQSVDSGPVKRDTESLEVARAMRTVLRRFVSPEWIQGYFGEPSGEEATDSK